MADEQPLFRELTSLLEALPRPHLVEIARQAAMAGFKGGCKRHFGEETLESVLGTLYPDFSSEQLAEAAREMALCAVRNTCWNQILSMPNENRVQVRCSNPQMAQALRQRKGPAILAFWHLGASFMMALGMQRIGVPGLIVARNPPPPWFRRAVSPEMRMAVTYNDPGKAVIALKMALDRLRKGGVVAMAVDGSQGQKDLTVSFLGRKISLSRGVAVLARLTGAPIIPCGVTWGDKDWSLDFRLFDPLALPPKESMAAEEWDQQVLNITAGRFEEIFRAFPGQARIERLSVIAKAPRA